MNFRTVNYCTVFTQKKCWGILGAVTQKTACLPGESAGNESFDLAHVLCLIVNDLCRKLYGPCRGLCSVYVMSRPAAAITIELCAAVIQLAASAWVVRRTFQGLGTKRLPYGILGIPEQKWIPTTYCLLQAVV